jgi:hypothetical protein
MTKRLKGRPKKQATKRRKRRPPETRAKISATLTGRKAPRLAGNRFGSANKGRKQSAEHIANALAARLAAARRKEAHHADVRRREEAATTAASDVVDHRNNVVDRHIDALVTAQRPLTYVDEVVSRARIEHQCDAQHPVLTDSAPQPPQLTPAQARERARAPSFPVQPPSSKEPSTTQLFLDWPGHRQVDWFGDLRNRYGI